MIGDIDELFQSLTRDSNHSNATSSIIPRAASRFNPSRGIAIIQTRARELRPRRRRVSIPHAG